MAKKKTDGTENPEDKLANEIAKALGSKGYHAKVLSETTELDCEVKEWISTGDVRLDLAISNRPNGGVPVGRVTELWGPESTGKSLLCSHIALNAVKDGGMVLYVDTEKSFEKDHFFSIFRKHGIDPHGKVIFFEATILEKAFDMVNLFIEEYVKRIEENKKALIIIDSIAGVDTEDSLKKDISEQGYATMKPKILGTALRRVKDTISKHRIALVLTNQVGVNMNMKNKFDKEFIRKGGKTVDHLVSVRVYLTNGSSQDFIDEKKEIHGTVIHAEVDKTRFGPGKRKIDFDFWYDNGIDSVKSLLTALVNYDIIDLNGAWYSFKDSTGNINKFQRKEFLDWKKENSTLWDEIYMKLCEKEVKQYLVDKQKSEENPEE